MATSLSGIQPQQEVVHFLKEFGLVLFVYAIGMQVGAGFFESLRKSALASNAWAFLMVILGVGATVLWLVASQGSAAVWVGVMSGAVTNTPGLGAAQAALGDMGFSPKVAGQMSVAYALSYPMGILGILLAMFVLRKALRIDLMTERAKQAKLQAIRSEKPVSVHLAMENVQLAGKTLREVFQFIHEPLVVSRMRTAQGIFTPQAGQVLSLGDVLLVVGPKHLIPKAKMLIGGEVHDDLRQGHLSNLVAQQVVVTRPEMTRKRLGEIPELVHRNFTMTRLNRAGIEMVPTGHLFLQLGDVVKVVGPEEGVRYAAQTLGNEVKQLDSPGLGGIFVGILLGLLLGSIPLAIPGIPVPVKIGLAGGPLIVSLVLTRFGGRLHVNSYASLGGNLMMRELGIALFLASVGLSSGPYLVQALGTAETYQWMLGALFIATVPLVAVGWAAHRWGRKTYFELCGLLAGASTDPPALAFATQMAGSDVPALCYATVYPLTMILRIVAAQALIVFLM
jgi:putative transport protein